MFMNVLIQMSWLVGFFIAWQLAATLGYIVLARLNLTFGTPLTRHLIGLATGLVTIGFGIAIVGALHLTYPWLLLGASLVLAGFAWQYRPWQDLSFNWQVIRRLPWPSQLLLGLLCLFALLNLVGALAPDIEFDSLWYHLTEARWYLQDHQVRIWYPSMLGESAVAPKLPDLINTWLLSPVLTSPTLPQLMHWLVGIWTAIGTFLMARKFTGPTYALLAAAIFYTTKHVGWLSNTAYVDLYVAFFAVAFGLLCLEWPKLHKQAGWRWLAILLFGGFLSSKMQALVFIPAAAIGVWAVTRQWKEVLWVIGGGLLLVIPWYLEIWLATGSPLFVFHRVPGDPHLGGGQTFGDYLLHIHPRTFLFDIERVLREEAPLYLVGLLPLVIWRQIPNFARTLLTIGWLGVIGWTYVPVHDPRYLLAAFPFLAIGIVAFLERIPLLSRRLLLLSFAVVIGLNFLLVARMAHVRVPVALGRESRHDYLAKALKDSDSTYYDYTNTVGKLIGNSKTLFLIHNSFYINFKGEDGFRWQTEYFDQVRSFDDLNKLWKAQGIRYLVTHQPYHLEQFVDPLDPDVPNSLSAEEMQKIHEHVVLRYSDDSQTKVWELQ